MDTVIIRRIVQETALPEGSVSATIDLFEKGATGPFIVRYRKEATGGLDEAKVRLIQERMDYYREVRDKRTSLIKSLSDQGKLTNEIRDTIENCVTKVELDDLQHRYRSRKKTRQMEAIAKGLEPLAEYFWTQEQDAWSFEDRVQVFVDASKDLSTPEDALRGTVDIIADWIGRDTEYRRSLRTMLEQEGFVVSNVVPAKVNQKTKYTMYYERRESVKTIPSHRVLAIRRGCKEGILISSIEGDQTKALEFLFSSVIKDKSSLFTPVLEAAVRESYSRVLKPLVETEVRSQLKERADREAIRVFQDNLANLLLSPPAGPLVVMGVDWGKDETCSVAVVSETGTYLEGTKVRFNKSTKPESPETKPASPQSGDTPDKPEKTQHTDSTATAATRADGPETGQSESEPLPCPAAPEESAEASSGTKTEEQAPENSEQEKQANSENEEPSLPTPETADPSTVVSPDPGELEIQEATSPAETAALDEKPSLAPLSTVTEDDLTANKEVPLSESADSSASVPNNFETARLRLKELILKHKVQAISIGAGTRTRELETYLRRIITDEKLGDIMIAAVNDAGIAIYSSSRIAREEFPDWNPSARCAVSLARRLQNPLSELVKIDPKLIGVGQYQHDVDQKELHRRLLDTVKFCVNKVGVNVNTAGESLLRYVSGLNDKIGRRITAYRSNAGPFKSRESIQTAVGIDPVSYQQSAAFLRIPDGENILDRTAIHPESYPIVEKMASALGLEISQLLGNREKIYSLKLEDFVSDTVGLPTLKDIREDLLKPGRDPRKSFKLPKFRNDVTNIKELQVGMTLEGTITNVTNFGAFVDIGVQQDGLVHLSQISNRFIRDPREAVKVGDIVRVKVISVESESKRIGLSMKALLPPAPRKRKKQQKHSKVQTRKKTDSAAAGKDGNASTAAVSNERLQQNRSRRNAGRIRNRGNRKPDKGENPNTQNTSGPDEPEPSLQEKIAILQSKFRRIN